MMIGPCESNGKKLHVEEKVEKFDKESPLDFVGGKYDSNVTKICSVTTQQVTERC